MADYINMNKHEIFEEDSARNLCDIKQLEQVFCITFENRPDPSGEKCPNCGEVHEHAEVTALIDVKADDAVEAFVGLMERDPRTAYIITKAAEQYNNPERELTELLNHLFNPSKQ